MEQKFQNKYRIQSTRLASWDYGWPGYYFVTICTKHRQCFFGEIHCLSEIGKIVQTEWLKTPEIRPDMNLKLGEFVVMPNHFHAIIQIGENEFNSRQMKYNHPGRDAMHRVSTGGVEPTGNPNPKHGDANRHFETTHRVSTTIETTDINSPRNQFGPQSKNLASIIRGFKSSVTRKARQIRTDFQWQSRFHEHIIRDEKSLNTISEYIRHNPANWEIDKFFQYDQNNQNRPVRTQ